MRLDAQSLSIGGRLVSPLAPLFVSAEIGMNHGGSTDRALSLVEAAAETGADAVTLQTIDAAQLASPTAPMPGHLPQGSLIDFFQRHQLDEPAHIKIVAAARKHGLKVVATPFSLDGVDLLERVGVDAYKVASGDLTWDQLIVRAAGTGKPLIIATGMSSLDEIAHAVQVAQASGAREIALLHTVSAHPVPPGHENLLAIRTLADRFKVPVGLADHAEDTFALPMAMALGASIYERHLVLPDDLDAADLAVSSLPDEFSEAINRARRAHAALGTGEKVCLEVEMMNRHIHRRALCAARDLEPGMVVRRMDLVALRPLRAADRRIWRNGRGRNWRHSAPRPPRHRRLSLAVHARPKRKRQVKGQRTRQTPPRNRTVRLGYWRPRQKARLSPPGAGFGPARQLGQAAQGGGCAAGRRGARIGKADGTDFQPRPESDGPPFDPVQRHQIGGITGGGGVKAEQMRRAPRQPHFLGQFAQHRHVRRLAPRHPAPILQSLIFFERFYDFTNKPIHLHHKISIFVYARFTQKNFIRYNRRVRCRNWQKQEKRCFLLRRFFDISYCFFLQCRQDFFQTPIGYSFSCTTIQIIPNGIKLCW